jgi:hypothetical protein
MHKKAIVNVVGINPDLWNTLGKFSMAGPVSEFTAIDTLPSIPIVPFIVKKIDSLMSVM